MASAPDPSAPDPIETFIARWQGREGGQERANLSLFINDFCKALALQPPDPAAATIEHNDFVYERRVDEPQPVGPPTARRIDLYKRAAFILEAKQSRQPGGRKALPEQLAIPTIAEPTRRGTRATAARAWDVLMFNARKQAQDYARHLAAKSPLALVMAIPDHPWTKLSPDAAAVRIAMTVAASGGGGGTMVYCN